MTTTSDSSGNGRTLTNAGANVVFNSGRFGFAADYGSTGTQQALDLDAANPMSSTVIPDMTFSFWFKLNNTTANNSTFANVFGLNTNIAATTGCRTNIHYTISGGNVTIAPRTTLSTTNASIDYVIAADNVWRHYVLVKSSTTTLTLYVNGHQVGTNTGAGTDLSVVLAAASFLTIGNSRDPQPKANAMWAEIDEFFIEERVYTAAEIKKMYTQYRGFRAAA
jgi:hypothetical protein